MEIIHIDNEDIYDHIIENYELNKIESEFLEDYGYITKNVPNLDDFEIHIQIINDNTYSFKIIDVDLDYNYDDDNDGFLDIYEEF